MIVAIFRILRYGSHLDEKLCIKIQEIGQFLNLSIKYILHFVMLTSRTLYKLLNFSSFLINTVVMAKKIFLKLDGRFDG